MIEYQNADYRSIYASGPIDVPRAGECWLVIFIEEIETEDCRQLPARDEWWTALFVVSPATAGPETIKDCLEATVGCKGEPTPIEAAVGLAEFGKRVVLWEQQGDDWEPDLAAAKREAARYLADPSLIHLDVTQLQ